jgi:hypothetical protein
MHKWVEPFQRDPVRHYQLPAFCFGIQKGHRQCEVCGHKQVCYREGMIGVREEKWKRCNRRTARFIDRIS